jgi:hypothetical protein
MKYLFIVLVTIFSLETYCQDSKSLLKNQIYPKAFSGWWVDGKKITTKQFKNEIYKVPAATLYYKKSVRQQGYFFVGVAAVTSYYFISKANKKNSPYQKNSIALDIAGFTTTAATFVFYFASIRNLKKAVRIHNESQSLLY